jgi:hypothetical protein
MKAGAWRLITLPHPESSTGQLLGHLIHQEQCLLNILSTPVVTLTLKAHAVFNLARNYRIRADTGDQLYAPVSDYGRNLRT